MATNALKEIGVFYKRRLHNTIHRVEANTALLKKEGKPAIHRVAGFVVPPAPGEFDDCTMALIDRDNTILANTNELIGEIDALSTDLTLHGLPPIAVLPTVLWRDITREFGVIRFDNLDKNGKAPACQLTPFQRLRLSTVKMETLVHWLWPNLHDSFNTGVRITPQFPAAPESFTNNLIHLVSLGQYHVCIAAVPEAVTINRKEVELAHQQFGMLPPEIKPKQDPILYTTKGDFTAVIDYFGNFPKEEQLVAWVKNWFDNLSRR